MRLTVTSLTIVLRRLQCCHRKAQEMHFLSCPRPRRRPGVDNGSHACAHQPAAAEEQLLFKRLRRGVSTIQNQLSRPLHSNSVLHWLLRFFRFQSLTLKIMGSPSSAPASSKPGSSGGKSDTNDVANSSTHACRASATAAGSSTGPSSSTSPATAVPLKFRSVPASRAKSNPAPVSLPKVPSSAMTDEGNDWCDSAPMDFSQRMDLLMAEVNSPPDEFSPLCHQQPQLRQSVAAKILLGSFRLVVSTRNGSPVTNRQPTLLLSTFLCLS